MSQEMRDVRGAMIFLMLLLCGPLWAADGAAPMANGGAHGTLDLALNGHALVAHLQLPALQVVGFTHAPADGEQRQAVSDALQRLGNADNVLVPVAAGCTITKEEAESSLALSAADRALKENADGNFRGYYAWHCGNPAALRAVNVPLLEFMNGVALDILVVSGGERHRLTLRFPDTHLVIGGE